MILLIKISPVKSVCFLQKYTKKSYFKTQNRKKTTIFNQLYIFVLSILQQTDDHKPTFGRTHASG